MAHFAKIENGIVTQVIAVGDEFVELFIDSNSEWIQTYKDDSQRYNYAGIGYTYDDLVDAFIAPNPECGHSELQLNDQYRWECSNDDHKTLA